MKIKNICLNIAMALIVTIANMTVFTLAYRKLVFPYLHEEQRMDNVEYIFSYILLSFFVVAILAVLMVSLLNKIKT